MKNVGLYPRVQADTDVTSVVSQAGGVALIETVRAAGLDQAFSTVLAPSREPMARHDPGKVITNLAITLALRGDCLADVALLRAPSHPCSARWPRIRRYRARSTRSPLMRRGR